MARCKAIKPPFAFPSLHAQKHEAAPHSAAEKTSLGYIVSVSQLVVTVANSERRNCNGMAQGGNDVDELADVLTQLLVGGLQLRESLGDRLWVTWGW